MSSLIGPSTLHNHPLLVSAFQGLLVSAALGLTPKWSTARAAILPVLFISLYHLVVTCPRFVRPPWGTLLATFSVALILKYLDRCLLNRWTFEDNPFLDRTSDLPKPANPPKSNGSSGARARSASGKAPSTLDRLKFGFAAAYESRLVNTEEEVKNCPRFDPDRPSWAPARKAFLLRETFTVVAFYLVIDLVASQPADDNKRLFAPERALFFSRIRVADLEEHIIRVVGTTVLFLTAYGIIQLGYKTAALLAVGTGLDDVRNWRPHFGSLSRAYTLRNFWGEFWHQSLRRPLGEPASWLTFNVLRLRKGGFAARYTHLALVFTGSGLLHAVGDLAAGLSLDEQGSLRFFMMQALGVMGEDFLAYLYRRATGTKRANGAPPELWVRRLGYCWVFAFMCWTTPSWFFPMAVETTSETKGFLPFSFFKAGWIEPAYRRLDGQPICAASTFSSNAALRNCETSWCKEWRIKLDTVVGDAPTDGKLSAARHSK